MMLLAVLGDERVARSLSPVMHNAALKAHGLEGQYLALKVHPAEVGEAVRGLKALGFAGANVTVPHKEAVLPYLSTLSDLARELLAVNTIVVKDGLLEGHNTDVGGFLAALEGTGQPPKGRAALVVGAGGAARAVVLGLRLAGAARVTVASRRLEQARELCGQLGGQAIIMDDLPQAAGQAEIIVNASAVSTPSESPEMAAMVAGLKLGAGCRLVMDLNYGRRGNFWRALAGRSSAAFLDGLSMLAAQAALSFNLWTGLAATAQEFYAALPVERP
ncbi:MAG: shikimate dehydrogenase [Desulfarculus sp.]|nr:shikimate dehydrogenase [Desulfarculus sp.]